MLIDAVLLSICQITEGRNVDTSVAILPGMRLASGDGVLISNPDTKYEAWSTGNVDYDVIQYPDQDDNKARFLGVDTSRDGILDLAPGRLYLFKAVGQAIALSELTSQDTLKFCLSNLWTFLALCRSG
ncbi:hypothetical protein DFH07DRAFT_839246 [Mycena maculata]|uniref:Uncharacterized protein n=1 Tax=Mycena maculata TaxID=230809 RepID=A0AAD7N0A6_9AGAR|nr:hypothetical protein DFH07DRAFT_839246 [Mycena maculata]